MPPFISFSSLSTIFVPTMKKFADVILPLPLYSYFTYSLPDEWVDEVQIGCRVVVPFGRKKYYTAIVRNVHYCAPTEYEVKEVSAFAGCPPDTASAAVQVLNGSPITISARKETSTKLPYPLA